MEVNHKELMPGVWIFEHDGSDMTDRHGMFNEWLEMFTEVYEAYKKESDAA